MSYHHILVAVDLSKGSRALLDKAVALARPLEAMVSLIHVDEEASHEGIFVGLIHKDLGDIETPHPTVSERSKKLDSIAAETDYPIKHKVLVHGDLSRRLEECISKVKADLLVCGHHHSFLSRIAPSSGTLLNTSPVDLLIVPLDD